MKQSEPILTGTQSASATTYYQEAQEHRKQGDMVMAVALLTKAIAEDRTFAQAYLSRSQALLAMGDLKAAKADADRLEAKWPDSLEVIMLQARIAYAYSDLESAIHYYNIALEIDNSAIEAYRERGKARLELGDSSGAAEDAKRVVELSPGSLDKVTGQYSADGIE